MIDIELTSAHDYKIENGDKVLIEGRLEVLQSTKIRLLWIFGEWVFNFLLGIPWMTDMFDVRLPRIQKENHIRKTITGTIGVRTLTNFTFNIDEINHGAFVGYEAETVFGPIEGNISV